MHWLGLDMPLEHDLLRNTGQPLWVRIPLIVDTHSRLITDSVAGDRGHRGWCA